MVNFSALGLIAKLNVKQNNFYCIRATFILTYRVAASFLNNIKTSKGSQVIPWGAFWIAEL